MVTKQPDRWITHSHLHHHVLGGKTADFPYDHGHWHRHDARERDDHEHAHNEQDVWPHKAAAIEVLP